MSSKNPSENSRPNPPNGPGEAVPRAQLGRIIGSLPPAMLNPPAPHPGPSGQPVRPDANPGSQIENPGPRGFPFPAPCSATTRAGKPCRFAARKATGLCINHDPAYAEQQRKNVERATSRSLQARTAIPIPLEHIDLSTRDSIQAILDAVVRLELVGRLPPVRARNILRALSIAMRNLDKRSSFQRSDEYYNSRWALRRTVLTHPELPDD